MKHHYLFKPFYFFTLLLVFLTSCNIDTDDEIFPMLGIYDAYVVGVAGPFSLSVSSDRGDDILIDAPFDGEIWSVVEADVDYSHDNEWKINIPTQALAPDVMIKGSGFYAYGTLQLNYSINFWGETYKYKIIAEQ